MKKNKININIEGGKWRVKPICQLTDKGFVQLPYDKGCGLEYRADENSWIVMSFFHVNEDDGCRMDWVREDIFNLNEHELRMWQKISKLIVNTYATFNGGEEDDE